MSGMEYNHRGRYETQTDKYGNLNVLMTALLPKMIKNTTQAEDNRGQPDSGQAQNQKKKNVSSVDS
jgi:hypothetical protein